MHRYHLDIVDWEKIKAVAELIEARTMERGDMKFGPLEVIVYSVGPNVLRVDFKADNV